MFFTIRIMCSCISLIMRLTKRVMLLMTMKWLVLNGQYARPPIVIRHELCNHRKITYFTSASQNHPNCTFHSYPTCNYVTVSSNNTSQLDFVHNNWSLNRLWQECRQKKPKQECIPVDAYRLLVDRIPKCLGGCTQPLLGCRPPCGCRPHWRQTPWSCDLWCMLGSQPSCEQNDTQV